MRVKPRNALYLLPNAFTTAALFFGFYAILQAINGDWQQSAISVFVAALLDACDGRVARLTGTESTFGVEYDSLADMVSFGLAPAILIFQWALFELGKVGFGAAFCYCAATALRLARFNTQAGSADRRFFIGIPSPAAAVLLVTFVASADKYFNVSPYWAVVLCVVMAITMVSGVRFYSFKTINLRARRPLYNGLLLIAIIAAINALSNHWLLVLFILLTVYTICNYVYAVWAVVSKWQRQ